METPLPDGLIPASHISNPLSVVGGPCLEPSLNVVRVFQAADHQREVPLIGGSPLL
jgi:hypothetical protein